MIIRLALQFALEEVRQAVDKKFLACTNEKGAGKEYSAILQKYLKVLLVPFLFTAGDTFMHVQNCTYARR